MLIPRRQLTIVVILFLLVMLLYVGAILYTFKFRSGGYFGELVAIVFTSIGGLVVFALGYASVVILGGKTSLRIVELISRLNGSRHVMETKETHMDNSDLVRDLSLYYFAASIVIIAFGLALNIHYIHTTTDVGYSSRPLSILQTALNAFDIFTKPTGVGSFMYSIEIIPVMISIVAVSGVVPSIVFPYSRRFNVTSINSAPFYRDFPLSVIGLVLGFTIVLSLVDVIYGAVIGSQPHYYDYVLPTMVGFSLHYSLGAHLGRKKAEETVEKALKIRAGKRVFRGKVDIQESSSG